MMISRLKTEFRKFRDLARNKSGVALVEFALIVPVLIGIYLGAVEFSQALTVDRRVTVVASAAADLVAQTEQVDTAALTDIYNLSKTILDPYDTASLSIVLTSIVADDKNATTVDWSQAFNGGAAHAKGSSYALPAALTQAFSSVIVAEVSYSYNSPVSEYITGPLKMTDTFYLRPRKSLKVEKTD